MEDYSIACCRADIASALVTAAATEGTVSAPSQPRAAANQNRKARETIADSTQLTHHAQNIKPFVRAHSLKALANLP